MKACRGEPTPYTPIWLMRQAGRYQPEYRAVRDKVSFIELCERPDLAAEVTIFAVESLGVDAAIIFADLLPILQPMGLKLEYVKGDGPVIHNPITCRADIDALKDVSVPEDVEPTLEAIRRTRRGLPGNIPLLGFAGAPFTLAAYAIEGGKSREFVKIKSFMYSEPEAFKALLEHLSRSVTQYLLAQIEAGVQAVQIFDSWVGSLSPLDYAEYAAPHTRSIIAGLPKDIPVIHFGTATGGLLPTISTLGASVIGMDFRISLEEARKIIGSRPFMGNLDPITLLADRSVFQGRAQQILESVGNTPGHIFNLGHGVLPSTPPENARALVDFVHEFSAALRAG